jgi:hypothetical protein
MDTSRWRDWWCTYCNALACCRYKLIRKLETYISTACVTSSGLLSFDSEMKFWRISSPVKSVRSERNDGILREVRYPEYLTSTSIPVNDHGHGHSFSKLVELAHRTYASRPCRYHCPRDVGLGGLLRQARLVVLFTGRPTMLRKLGGHHMWLWGR